MFHQLHSHLYQDREPLFEGYKPEKSFEHAGEVVVARVPAMDSESISSVLFETKMPARFFRAELQLPDTQDEVLVLSTGSGDDIGRLLHELCQGLSNGTLLLEAPDNLAWRRKKLYRPQEDGAQAEVFATSKGLAKVDIAESSHLTGSTCSLTVFCGSNLELARRIAEAASEGMLGARYRRETKRA